MKIKLYIWMFGLLFLLSYQKLCQAKNKQDKDQRHSISKNFFFPHSFLSGSSTEILQEKYLMNPIYDHVDRFLQFSFLGQFQQSVRKEGRNSLGSMPFWSGTNVMTFGNNNGKADFDVYQFALGDIAVNKDGIAGYIKLESDVQQAGCDIFVYYMREKNKPGLYFKIHAPLSSMTIKTCFKEVNYEPFSNTDAFTQVTQEAIPGDIGSSTEITYYDWRYPSIQAGRPHSVAQFLSGASFNCDYLEGNVLEVVRLHSGRLIFGRKTITNFVEVALAMGYNWVMREKGFFGTALKVSYPTGNLAQADFMLEPIIGRSGLLGVGGEMTGKYRIWENARSEHAIDMWIQGEILHLIPIRRPNMRSFDLKCNGKGSKYILVQNYAAEFTPTFGVVDVGLKPQIIHPAVNITTLPVRSHIAVEGTLATFFEYYHHRGFNVGIGGEVWGRSREHLCIDKLNAAAQRFPNLNDFAVIGRQHGQYLINGQDLTFNPLSTYFCEPCATINKSQDPVRLVGLPPFVTVPGTPAMAISPEFESILGAADAPVGIIPAGIKDARLAENRIPADFNEALDICGAEASSVVTAKIFTQIGYAWKDYFYVPSIGIHASFEFAPNTNNAVNLWSVGAEIALSF